MKALLIPVFLLEEPTTATAGHFWALGHESPSQILKNTTNVGASDRVFRIRR